MHKHLIRGLVIGLGLALLVAAIAARVGRPIASPPLPEGSGAWLAARAGGLTAYLALSLEIVFGLFLSTGVADRWIARGRAVELHQWLSLATLGLVAGHAGVLLLDRFVGFDALDLVVPFLARFPSEERRVGVGLGVLGGWIMLLVHASFALRARLGARAWRLMHYAAFVAFGLATAHGATAGTDASQPPARALYLGMAALVGLLLLARLFRASHRRAAAKA